MRAQLLQSISRIVAGSSGLLLLALVPAVVEASDFDQSWNRHTIDSGLNGGDGVRSADVDGDLDLDLVVGYEEAGVVRIYRNPGPSAAKDPWPFVSFSGGLSSVEDANLVDLDGDGRHDVVVSTEGSNRDLVILWAPAAPGDYWDAGNWTTMDIPAAAGQQWMFSQALDLDGQNGPDIIAGSKNSGGTVSWLKAPANPRVAGDWVRYKMTDAGWIMSLEPEDMDGDGDIDFLISDRRSGGDGQAARWLENPGSASPSLTSEWTTHFVAGSGTEVMFLDVMDVDEDGLKDVVIPIRSTSQDPDNWLIARRLDASGQSWSVQVKTFPGATGVPGGTGNGKAMLAVDIDGDGKKELAASFGKAFSPRQGVIWLEKPPDPLTGTWSGFPIAGGAGNKFDLIEAIDLDGDGDLDLISTDEDESSANNGLGTIWYENPANDPVLQEALYLLAFTEQAYSSDGTNSWQAFDLNTGTGDAVGSGPATITNSALLDSDGDGSAGLSFSVSATGVGSDEVGYQIASRLTGLDWSASPFSWFSPAEDAQLDVFSIASGTGPWSFTFDGFDPADEVSFDFVFGRSKTGDRAMTVTYVSTGDVLNDAQVDEDGGPQYPVAANLTGATSYTFSVQPTGADWACLPNAIAVRVVKPLTFAEQWRLDFFGQTGNTGDAADDFDFDGGGLVNLLERAAGTSPVDGSDDAAPSAVFVDESGTEYGALTYQRLKGGTTVLGNDYTVNGMTYTVEVTPTLEPAAWDSDPALFVEVGTLSLTDEVEEVTVRLVEPVGANSSAFLRLNVIELDP